MELEAQLSRFYHKIETDARINATQICVYVALLIECTAHQGINPFPIQRRRIMGMSKISARSTFSRSMKELHRSGYIKYIPSQNPDISSMVCLHDTL